MSYEVVEEHAIVIQGISTRASNAEPQKIGELWQRFHALGDAAAIPARIADVVYSVYCEYAGDYTAPYTVVLGCAVAPDAAVPEGLHKIVIEPGRFTVCETEGLLPQGVFDAWARIWSTSLDRRYQADYDLYATDGKVTVHVGIK